MRPRHLLIRCLTPLVWRISERRKLEALQMFSLVEKDSGCQILSAIGLVQDPEVRARLFQQALEEFHHHDLFDGACRALARAPLGIPVMERDDLVGFPASRRDALLDFLAYLHVSEREVNTDFAVYEGIRTDGIIKEVFKKIHEDERHHEEDSLGLLRRCASFDDARLRRALLKSAVTRVLRSILGFLRQLGEIPLALALGALYFLSGPFFFRTFQKRLVLSAPEQLDILREQWKDCGGQA